MNRPARLSLSGATILVAVGCATARSTSLAPVSAQRVAAGAAWDDPERCQLAVAAGARLRRAHQRLRLGSWNLDGFPRGGAAGRSDLGWLACAIAWLDVDLLALQGLTLDAAGGRALAKLLEALSRTSTASWQWGADECPGTSRNRGVIVYREDRVRLSGLATHPQLDPTRSRSGTPACPGNLRPALGAYVESVRGTLDFHLVAVHLDAGREGRDFAHRQQAWVSLAAIAGERQLGQADTDLVVLGDFSTAGCPSRGVEDDQQEVVLLREALAAAAPPWALIEQPLPCTAAGEQGELQARSQVVVNAGMREAVNASARNTGVCAAARCRPLPVDVTPALLTLSRHCPLVFDLLDEDLDP